MEIQSFNSVEWRGVKQSDSIFKSSDFWQVFGGWVGNEWEAERKVISVDG